MEALSLEKFSYPNDNSCLYNRQVILALPNLDIVFQSPVPLIGTVLQSSDENPFKLIPSGI